jgi:glutaredoxin 3
MPADVTIYTTGYCGYCYRAKALLESKGVRFEEIRVEGRDDLRSWLRGVTRQSTVPQVFVNGRSLGGYSDIADLDDEGGLDPLLAEDPPADRAALRR